MKINFIYLIIGLICILFSILYLLNLRKRSKKDDVGNQDLFTQSLNWQGWGGGFCLLVMGLIMLCRELYKLL